MIPLARQIDISNSAYQQLYARNILT